MINHYKILKIEFSATEIEIKKAFRKLAIIYHPDKNKGDLKTEDVFKTILNSYEILSNKGKKTKYDIEFQKNIEFQQNKETNSNNKKTDFGFDTKYSSKQYQHHSNTNKPIINYKLMIFILIIIIISLKFKKEKTTTGNKKADFELENQKENNSPQSGEIEFKK